MRESLHAEWIKVRSIRSGPLLLLAAVAVGIVLSRLGAVDAASGPPGTGSGPDGSVDAVADCLNGLPLAQVLLGVLGVLVTGSEHGTGMISTTLVAMPRRGRAFAAKVLVVGVVALVAAQLVCWTAFLANRSGFAAHGMPVGVGDPGVLRAVTAAGLYLCAVTLIGAGLGAALRSVAGGLAAWFVTVFLLSVATGALERWSLWPSRLALINAGDVLVRARPVLDERMPSVAVAFVVLAGYPLLALGLGWWRTTRDV